jgi:hypothetical protein
MTVKHLAAALAALLIAGPAMAGIAISDAYAVAATPMAKTGAVYLTITNDGDTEDRLMQAARVELHTHTNRDGMMAMEHLAEGRVIAPHASHALERGGDHVMFMGLTGSWRQGDLIPLTLEFEDAGEISIEVPVDLTR